MTASFLERLEAFERRCEAHLAQARCPVHLCFGQFEVPAALNEELRPEDWLYSTHRNHGHYLAKGGSEERLWDEIMGLESGINGGFSGSQCFSDPAIHFHATALVGGLLGVAAGTALALKYDRSPAIVVACMGDGAAEQGVFWEAANFSALHLLPIVYICENNGYSVHAGLAERQAAPIGPRAVAFGLNPCHSVREGIAAARDGVPAFVEVRCERQCRHVGLMADLRHETG